VFSCGESFPVEQAHRDEYRSSGNRRVEVVFFEKGQSFTLSEPADRNKLLTGDECPVYAAYCRRRITKMEPVAITRSRKRILVPWLIDCHMHINTAGIALPCRWSMRRGLYPI
jgi:hypothetical protein